MKSFRNIYFPAALLLLAIFFLAAAGPIAPVGNGVTDDRVALQRLVDATPSGGTLVLPGNKTFFVSLCVYLRKPITLDLNGATILKSDNGTTGQNQPIRIETELGTARAWSEPLAMTTNVLHVGVANLAGLAVGTDIWLRLGTSLRDPMQSCWCGWVKVTAVNRTGAITLNRSLPYAVDGTAHQFYVPATIAQDITVRNGHLSEVALNHEANWGIVYCCHARRVALENLTMFGGGIVLDESEQVRGDDLDIQAQTSGECGVGGWHVQDCRFDNVTWRSGYVGKNTRQFISVEDHTFGLTFGTVDADMGPDGNNHFCNVGPGSRVAIDHARVVGASLVDQGGGGGGTLLIGDVQLFGHIFQWNLQNVNHAYLNGSPMQKAGGN